MKHSINNYGFSLIEVLLATAIVGLAITPLMILQTQGMFRSTRAERIYQRVSKAYYMMLDHAYAQGGGTIEPFKGSIKHPRVSFQGTASEIPSSSTLVKIPHLERVEVVSSWKEKQRAKKETMILFRLKKPTKEDNGDTA